MINTALLIVLLGLLDRGAWWLAAETQQERASYGAALLIVAAALRGVLPMLLSQKRQAPGIGKSLVLTLASLFGLVLAFCLAAWWVGVVYAAALLPVFTPEGLDFSRGWVWLGTIAVIVGSYALVTGRNFAFLNVSSLHMFYKARIVRGYLGAANARAPGRQPDGRGLGPRAAAGAGRRGRCARRHLAASLCAAPAWRAGAPGQRLHQPDARHRSRSCSTATARASRSPSARCGWMQAGGANWAQAHGDGALTLGAWTAISGAAFAPGLGPAHQARHLGAVGVRGAAARLLVEQRRGRRRAARRRACTPARC